MKYIAKTEPIFEAETKAGAKFAQHMKTDAGRHIHCRVISAPEVAARLLHIPHAKGTDKVQFLETAVEERVRRLKPKWQLDGMDADSTDVCCSGKLETYMRRPADDLFNGLLYPEYFERFRVLSNGQKQPKGGPVYKDRDGRRVVARAKLIYCRWHFKKPHVDKEAFYFQQVLRGLVFYIEWCVCLLCRSSCVFRFAPSTSCCPRTTWSGPGRKSASSGSCSGKTRSLTSCSSWPSSGTSRPSSSPR